MRILRGKSDSEVSSQGFAWFVVGLVLATFIGGAVRTLLRSEQVHARIVNELKSRFPKHEFQIGKTEVLLSSGLWPGLGLKVENLKFEQERCDKISFKLAVPHAILPIDLFSLARQQPRLKRIVIEGARLHLDYKPCPESTASSPREALVQSTGTGRTIEPAQLNWRKASQHFDGIEIKNLVLTYERNPTWRLSVEAMAVDLGAKELSAEGRIVIHKSLPFGELSHAVEFEASGDDNQLDWGFHAEFKEGSLALNGEVDLAGGRTVVQANAKQLPLKDVSHELHKMGFLSKDFHPKAAWVSCELKWEGLLKEPSATPVNIESCELEGSYGRVHLARADFWIDQTTMFKEPARIRIDRLQLQPLLEALNRKVLPRVLARPGIWTGELSFLSPQSWSLDGQLENAEILFSNQSVRGKQTLERVRTKVDRSGAQVRGEINELKIQGGEFDGRLEFAVEDDGRSGHFAANVGKLSFSPTIQMLLVGGKIAPLSVRGEGRLKAGELEHWSGDFSLSSIEGIGWSGKTLQMSSSFQSESFQIEAKAGEMSVNQAWAQFAQIKTVLADVSAPVVWREVQARMEIRRGGGTLQMVSGTESTRAQLWRLSGSWVRDGLLSGSLLIGAGPKPRVFNLKGQKGILAVQPESIP